MNASFVTQTIHLCEYRYHHESSQGVYCGQYIHGLELSMFIPNSTLLACYGIGHQHGKFQILQCIGIVESWINMENSNPLTVYCDG